MNDWLQLLNSSVGCVGWLNGARNWNRSFILLPTSDELFFFNSCSSLRIFRHLSILSSSLSFAISMWKWKTVAEDLSVTKSNYQYKLSMHTRYVSLQTAVRLLENPFQSVCNDSLIPYSIFALVGRGKTSFVSICFYVMLYVCVYWYFALSCRIHPSLNYFPFPWCQHLICSCYYTTRIFLLHHFLAKSKVQSPIALCISNHSFLSILFDVSFHFRFIL